MTEFTYYHPYCNTHPYTYAWCKSDSKSVLLFILRLQHTFGDLKKRNKYCLYLPHVYHYPCPHFLVIQTSRWHYFPISIKLTLVFSFKLASNKFFQIWFTKKITKKLCILFASKRIFSLKRKYLAKSCGI